ncbi:MAG: ABC transporter ATP-binding protein [Clostridia bacterium]|nr:ABC transporter ATP-binding protein [Clostridia bacterium]
MRKIRAFLSKIAEVSGSIRFGFFMTWTSAPFQTLGVLFTYLGMSFLPILSAYALKEVINDIVSPTDSSMFALWLGVFLCITIGEKLLNKLSYLAFRTLEENVYHAIDNMLIEKILTCDLSFFDNSEKYDMLKIVQDKQYEIGNIAWRSIYAAANMISTIATLTVFVSFSPFLAVVVLLCGIPAIVLNKNYYDFIWNYDWSKSTDYRKMHYYGDTLKSRACAEELRLYNNFDYFSNKFFTLWQSWYRDKNKHGIRHNLKMFCANIVQTLGIGIVFVYSLFSFAAGKIAVGDIQYMVNLGEQVKAQLGHIFDAAVELGKSSREISVIRDFLNWKPQIPDHGDKTPGPLPEITFKNVTFRYPNTERNVLEDCTFTINSGEKVAFVGLNGAGKSTIIKLLLRFYDPNEGEILIDGINAREYDIRALRRIFGAQFQDYVTYSMTVEENITLSDGGKLDAEKLQRALAFSGADQMVKYFEQGTGTQITRLFDKNGEELSGGQRQKLSLSRAFYRDADILILDEPSASLDPEAEHEIFSKFISLWKNKGAILISHRLSNVTACDRIIVLDGCHITEQGTHRDLMKLNGKYAYLFKLQADKYSESF